MAEFDYRESIEKDTLEQFRGKPNLQVLYCALAKQLQDVYDFFVQLREERNLSTAIGEQLDGVGDIAVLSRMEAGLLAGNPIPFDVIDDEMYRKYLIYKIFKNTCDCTYPDIIKACQMFWDKPLYYSEDPEQPATMIFNTGELTPDIDTVPLLQTPLLRAAGVTLRLCITLVTGRAPPPLYMGGVASLVVCVPIPEQPDEYDFQSKVHIGGHLSSMVTMPVSEQRDEFMFQSEVRAGGQLSSVATIPVPEQRDELTFQSEMSIGGRIEGTITCLPIVERADDLSAESAVRAGGKMALHSRLPAVQYHSVEGG